MTTITGFSESAAVIGTTGADTFIYDPSGDKDAGAEPAPNGLTVDGRGGSDTFDFVSYDDGARVVAGAGTYDANTSTLNLLGGKGIFTSIETVLFDNGTLDLSNPATIAGQTFFDIARLAETVNKDGKATFNVVDNVFITQSTGGGTFNVGTVGETPGGKNDDYDYVTVNGASLNKAVVHVTEGTFSVVGPGNLQFEVYSTFLDTLAPGELHTFSVDVGIQEDNNAANAHTETYTITIEGRPVPPFVFTPNNDTALNYDENAISKNTDITAMTAANVVNALAGDDTITGSPGANIFFGNTGNDTIYAGDLSDIVVGGDGNDTLGGGSGDDIIVGDGVVGVTGFGPGNLGSAADDGDDLIYGGAGDDVIFTGTLSGGTVSGLFNDGKGGSGLTYDTKGASVLGSGTDTVWAGDGNDQVAGDAGKDTIGGGNGMDLIYGGGGNDTLYGGNDDDVLFGEGGNDTIYGGSGNDFMDGGLGADTLWGKDGIDTLMGGSKDDNLNGGDGDDILSGGSDNDILNGGADNDILNGDTGSDKLNGDEGNDTLFGGFDSDIFIFNTNGGLDFISDFNKDEDVIDVSSFGTTFAALEAAAYQVNNTIFIDVDATTTISINTAAGGALNGLTGVTDLDAGLFIV